MIKILPIWQRSSLQRNGFWNCFKKHHYRANNLILFLEVTFFKPYSHDFSIIFWYMFHSLIYNVHSFFLRVLLYYLISFTVYGLRAESTLQCAPASIPPPKILWVRLGWGGVCPKSPSEFLWVKVGSLVTVQLLDYCTILALCCSHLSFLSFLQKTVQLDAFRACLPNLVSKIMLRVVILHIWRAAD